MLTDAFTYNEPSHYISNIREVLLMFEVDQM